jgi:hypothetical protein
MPGNSAVPIPAFGANAGTQGSGTFAAMCALQVSAPTESAGSPSGIAAGNSSSPAVVGKTVASETPNSKDTRKAPAADPANAALLALLALLPIVPGNVPLATLVGSFADLSSKATEAIASASGPADATAVKAKESSYADLLNSMKPRTDANTTGNPPSVSDLSQPLSSLDPSSLLRTTVPQAGTATGVNGTLDSVLPSADQSITNATALQPSSLWPTQLYPQGGSQLSGIRPPQNRSSSALGDSSAQPLDSPRAGAPVSEPPVNVPAPPDPTAFANSSTPAVDSSPLAAIIATSDGNSSRSPDATSGHAPSQDLAAQTTGNVSPTPALEQSNLLTKVSPQTSMPSETPQKEVVLSSSASAQAAQALPNARTEQPNNHPASNILEAVRSGLHPLLNDALKSLAGDILAGLPAPHLSGSYYAELSASAPSPQAVIPAASSGASLFSATPARNFSGETIPTVASGNPTSPLGGAVAATGKQSQPPDTTSPASSDASLHKNPAPSAALVPPAPATQTSAAAPPASPAIQSPVAPTDSSLPTHKPDRASPNSPGAFANAPASPEMPATPPAGPVQLAEMASKAAQSEMRIGMTTSAFGNVEVRTVVHANDVGVLIGSEKGDLRALLANDLPVIANTLQQQNLRLHQVNFHQGSALSYNQQPGGNSQPRSFASKTAPGMAARREALNPDPGETAGSSRVCLGGGLSVLA